MRPPLVRLRRSNRVRDDIGNLDGLVDDAIDERRVRAVLGPGRWRKAAATSTGDMPSSRAGFTRMRGFVCAIAARSKSRARSDASSISVLMRGSIS